MPYHVSGHAKRLYPDPHSNGTVQVPALLVRVRVCGSARQAAMVIGELVSLVTGTVEMARHAQDRRRSAHDGELVTRALMRLA